jgi:lysozyme
MDLNKFIKQLKIHEGIRREVYHDTTGNRTIGVGFNLERMDAPDRLRSVGADYHKVVTKQSTLTDEQIEQLLALDITDAETQIYDLIPNYDQLNDVRQRVVLDMFFNLGKRGFREFINTRKFIVTGEYEKASHNMLRSKWAEQVKGRATKLASMMKTGEEVYD